MKRWNEGYLFSVFNIMLYCLCFWFDTNNMIQTKQQTKIKKNTHEVYYVCWPKICG